jgi:hypothetical protein
MASLEKLRKKIAIQDAPLSTYLRGKFLGSILTITMQISYASQKQMIDATNAGIED